jgi:hypothetical protein
VSKAVFESLSTSIEEAAGILSGEISDYESWQVPGKNSTPPPSVLAVFAGQDEHMITGKIYTAEILPSKRLLVTDEAGDSVICPADDFLILSFQPKAEKLLRQLLSVE